MVYKVTDIAGYIVSYFTQNSESITNLKLQKLLYFAWIDYYKENNDYLFDVPMVAWPLGPVSLDAYRKFFLYGARPIRKTFDIEPKTEDKKIIDRTLEKYRKVSANDLVEMSHRQGGAWSIVYKGGEGRNTAIPFEVIITAERT